MDVTLWSKFRERGGLSLSDATTASLVHRGWQRMARAIRTSGCAILLLSTMYSATVYAQRERIRGAGAAPAPAPPAPTAQTTPATPSQPAAAQPTDVAPSMLQQPAKDAQIVFADG